MALTKISRSLLDTGVSDSSDATAITIDSSERVGIGTTSPAFKLDVNGSLASNGNENVMRIAGSDTNNAGGITINAVYGATASARVSTLFSIDGQNQASPLAFGSGTSEKMRIGSSGEFLVGKTANNQALTGFQITGSNLHNVTSTNSGTGSSTYMVHDGSGLNFYVNFTGQVFYRVALSNLSDQRLKENVVILDKGLDDILKIKPRRFDWIEREGEKNQIGFIAQEIEEAGLEELVSHYKGASLDDAKAVNQVGLIPILVKAIQELSAKVEELESKINE